MDDKANSVAQRLAEETAMNCEHCGKDIVDHHHRNLKCPIGETIYRASTASCGEILKSFDAQVWAQAFVKLATAKPEIATDEGTMIGWFANALMRGYDEYRWRQEAALVDTARPAAQEALRLPESRDGLRHTPHCHIKHFTHGDCDCGATARPMPSEDEAEVAQQIVRDNTLREYTTGSGEVIVNSRTLVPAIATALSHARRQGAEAERQKEFICTRCGIRKDGEVSDQPEF